MRKLTRRKFIQIVGAASTVMAAGLLAGCGDAASSASSSEPVSSSISSSVSSSESASSEVLEETTSSSVAEKSEIYKLIYTLEECQEEGGLYEKIGEDAFVHYNEFGCGTGYGQKGNAVMGYFGRYDTAREKSVDKELCFFMWPEYSTSTFSVGGEKINEIGFMPKMYLPGGDEYRMITEIYRTKQDERVTFWSSYGQFDNQKVEILTIDGEPAYESDKIVGIKKYEASNDVIYTFSEADKGEKVTLGYAEGTTLVEQDVWLSMFYGICSNASEDCIRPTITPTKDGYAILDFSECREGLYTLTIGISNVGSKTTLMTISHSA